MTRVQRSILLSAAERYASVALFFVSTAILARLLSPREFGIYAVVNAITMVISVSAQEFGGANYLIQKETLSENNVRTAFTVTFSLSLVFAILLWQLGELFGGLYDIAGVAAGVKIAALGFLLSPFSATLIALRRRKLDFGVIAVSNLISNLANVTVSIALASRGYSYFGPLWGQFAGVAAQGACLAAWRQDFRIFLPSFVGHREVVHFGLYSFGVALINLAYGAAPQLLLARVLDFGAVGLYSRAVTLSQAFDRLVIQAVNPVIMPAIMSQTRAGENLKPIYLRAVSLLASLQWPFLLLIAVLAEPIVNLWLGPGWGGVAPLVRLYCVASLSLVGASLTYPVLVAAGGVRDALVSSLISLPPSLGVLAVASYFGVEAVAASALLTLPLQAAVATYFIARRLHFGVRDLLVAVRASAVAALGSTLAAALGETAAQAAGLGAAGAILAGGLMAGIAWLAGLAALEHPLLASMKQAAMGLGRAVHRGGAGRLARHR